MTVWEQLINSEAEALFSIVRKEQEERFSWVIDRWELARELNEQSKGDLAAPTVATQASPRAGPRLGHSVSVNYRKGEGA